LNGQAQYFTLSLDGASSFKAINETFILEDDHHKTKERALKTLVMAYARAPFFKDVHEIIREIVLNPDNNIATYNENIIKKICNYLNIRTRIITSSNLEKDNALKSKDKVVDICKRLHTSVYVNAIGGKELYIHEDFKKYGMQLKFLRSRMERITYAQFGKPFFPGLSIIDILMFNSQQDAQTFLDEYSLED
jgi:hypothetical protein